MTTATTAGQSAGTATIPTVRNADFDTMFGMLKEMQSRAVDLVVPADKLRFQDGMLEIAGQEMILEDDGFTDPNGCYRPTQIFDDQVAERLQIGTAYLRSLRHGRVNKKTGKQAYPPRLDLWDANVTGLLHGRKEKQRLNPGAPNGMYDVVREGVEPDPRSFFVRLLRTENGVGVARALLSNRFARLDHIDGLLAMLNGIQDAGIDPGTLKIRGDLSETRMFVHVAAPQILAAAPDLLAGYRSPFDTASEQAKRTGGGYAAEERIRLGRIWAEKGRAGLAAEGYGAAHGFFTPGTEPLVHAGFLLTNSEVGFGRWVITPEITILRCTNGLTMNSDAFGRTHVGGELDDGHVQWSADTASKELAFVTAQTRDVVKAVLKEDYLIAKIDELNRKAGREVDRPEKTIEVVAKKLAFTKEEADGILRHFLLGGQLTTGGVMNAVTSFAQTIADADAAHDLNSRAIDAMNMAYVTV